MKIKIITSPKKMQKVIHKLKTKTPHKQIGFVATMGALHRGHISLFKKSIKQNDISIVSIYVNKTQFNSKKDFESYPNTLKKDLKICAKAQVDIVFAPKNLYFGNKMEHLIKASSMANNYEGVFRVSHFDGMLRVVLKLLNIITPTRAYFGKKDAQQLCLIKQMSKVFFINSKIIACGCVREKNNLAISSRNIHIAKNELRDSLKLSQALFMAKKIILNKTNAKKQIDIKTILQAKVKANFFLDSLDVEYFDIVNKNFVPYAKVNNDIKIAGQTKPTKPTKQKLIKLNKNNIIIILAVKFDKTRLIDSLWV